MKKHFSFKLLMIIVCICSAIQSNAQIRDTSFINAHPNKYYNISWKADLPITAAGVGLSVYGLALIGNKDSLTIAQLNAKSKDDIPFFDRGNAGYYSDKANDKSYPPFFAAFAMPVVVMLIDKNERNSAGKILVMYTEALSITSAMFTMSAGLVDRSRPMVYGDKASVSQRVDKDAQRAFYSGHVAATATASFFAAEVFAEMNPDSKFKPYMWAISATLPAVVGYYRYKAGAHFLSDNVLGYALGAATGILVPKLHKSKTFEKVAISPAMFPNAKGVAVAYNF